MTRLIDADALKEKIDFRMWDIDDVCPHDEASNRISEDHAVKKIIDEMPTIDAVPTEFVMEIGCLEFVCDELTDDGEWCSERCQYSEPQPECIHRYIDRIWRKEHDTVN